ncbi:MAG: hypothetical protein GWN14_19105 [candidate division Zixibacteria bacterium]|nr:hypothetical protein [Gammaproteobacteria bacterium]NIX57968.1 hypothetical protein [candidate division Zixibacteria bacterium]
MLITGLGISLFAITAFLMRESIPFWMLAVFFPFGLIGLFIIGGGIYQLFGMQKTIFNPETGQAWQQTKIFGLPVVQSETSAIEVIPWTGSPARVMRYPASVAELYRDGKASDLFSTSLLQLAAQGVVTIGQVKIQRKFGRSTQVYVLLPGENDEETDIRGDFEKRIAEVINLANNEAAVFDYRGHQYMRTHRSVLCLEDAVRMVFESENKGPDQFLVYEFVGEEAESLGLGELKGNLRANFLPGKNTLGKISLDIRSVDQLHRDFWTAYPEHARDLLAQIDLLIFSFVSVRREAGAKSKRRG